MSGQASAGDGGNQGGTADIPPLFFGRDSFLTTGNEKPQYADYAEGSDFKEKGGDMENLVFQGLTYQIRGALIAVHCALGPGFREETYHRALLLELETRGIAFETETEIRIKIR